MKQRNITGGALSLFALSILGLGCSSLKPSTTETSNTATANKPEAETSSQPNSSGEYVFTAEKYCSQFTPPEGMPAMVFKKGVSAKLKDKSITVSAWMDNDGKEQLKYKTTLDKSLAITVKCAAPPYNSPTFTAEFDTASMSKPDSTKLVEKVSAFTKNQPIKLKCVGAGEESFFETLRKCTIIE